MNGKGQLTLIAHVNPEQSHAAETAETLNFAKQASLMRAKVMPCPALPCSALLCPFWENLHGIWSILKAFCTVNIHV